MKDFFCFEPEKLYIKDTPVIIKKQDSEFYNKQGNIVSFNKENFKFKVYLGNGMTHEYSIAYLDLVNIPKKKYDFNSMLNKSNNENSYNYSYGVVTKEDYLKKLAFKVEFYKKFLSDFENALDDENSLIFYGYDRNEPDYLKIGDLAHSKYGDLGIVTKIDSEKKIFTFEDEFGNEKTYCVSRISYVSHQ